MSPTPKARGIVRATHAPKCAPPPSTCASTDRGADTRSRLLEASIRVLLAEGMHALSQTRVAQEAGLRQSHLTYYFPTRVDLLKAVVEFADASIIGMVEGRPEALPRSLTEMRDRLVAPIIDRKMPRLMLAMQVAADEEPGLHEWMRGFDARMQERLVAVMAGFGLRPSPRDFALFHASMIGIAVQNAWRHDDASAREARRLMHAAFDRLVQDAGGVRFVSGVPQ
jgi:AcrR family transcriptional regulator